MLDGGGALPYSAGVTQTELCHSPNFAILAGVAMIMVVGGSMCLLLLAKKAPRGRVALLFGIFLAVALAISAGVLHKNPYFISYAVGDGNVTLGFSWPKASVTIPVASLKKVGIKHGVVRQREKGGAVHTADAVWIVLDGDGGSWTSCSEAGPDRLAEAGKALAAAAHVEPTWRVHCEDGHELPTTDEDVARGGSRWDGEFAPRCAAK